MHSFIMFNIEFSIFLCMLEKFKPYVDSSFFELLSLPMRMSLWVNSTSRGILIRESCWIFNFCNFCFWRTMLNLNYCWHSTTCSPGQSTKLRKKSLPDGWATEFLKVATATLFRDMNSQTFKWSCSIAICILETISWSSIRLASFD